MMTRGLGCLAVAMMVLAIGNTAFAQPSDDERARAHFLAGTSYFESARYAEAHDQFLEAYRLSHRIELLVNASTAAERNLDFAEAILLVDRFLSEAPANHPARTMQTDRRARLVELAARSTPNNPPPDNTHVEPAHTEPAADTGGGGLGTTGYIGLGTMGAGGALGIVSIITGVVANSRYNDLSDRCGGPCPAADQDDVAAGRRMARTSTATTFIGVGALVAGLVLVLVDDGPAHPSDATASRFEITSGPGDAGVSARWSF